MVITLLWKCTCFRAKWNVSNHIIAVKYDDNVIWHCIIMIFETSGGKERGRLQIRNKLWRTLCFAAGRTLCNVHANTCYCRARHLYYFIISVHEIKTRYIQLRHLNSANIYSISHTAVVYCFYFIIEETWILYQIRSSAFLWKIDFFHDELHGNENFFLEIFLRTV